MYTATLLLFEDPRTLLKANSFEGLYSAAKLISREREPFVTLIPVTVLKSSFFPSGITMASLKRLLNSDHVGDEVDQRPTTDFCIRSEPSTASETISDDTVSINSPHQLATPMQPIEFGQIQFSPNEEDNEDSSQSSSVTEEEIEAWAQNNPILHLEASKSLPENFECYGMVGSKQS
jgi:hypothetical protein